MTMTMLGRFVGAPVWARDAEAAAAGTPASHCRRVGWVGIDVLDPTP
jgi:hypothetical protein